jgi:hypothetical protein
MHRIVSEIGGDMIAIAAIVMGIGFAMFSLYLRSRRKREFLQMHHAERMAAIEKGIELPPVPPQFFHDGPAVLGPPYYCRRRGGWVTLLVGVAIMVALWEQGGNGYWWGLVVIAVGVGRIIDSAFISHYDVPRVPGPPGPDGRPDAR